MTPGGASGRGGLLALGSSPARLALAPPGAPLFQYVPVRLAPLRRAGCPCPPRPRERTVASQPSSSVRQLFARDLEPGDLLLKFSDGSVVSRIITAGQRLFGQLNPTVVHAGIVFDGTYVIEAQTVGLNANDIRVQTRDKGYLVYRALNPALARGAGTCAKMMFDIQSRHGNMPYNFAGAATGALGGPGHAPDRGSMDDLLDRILEGKGQPFFCSQFVAYVFQFVAEQNGIPAASLFAAADAKTSPSNLATRLQGHAFFTEAGYLAPGER